MSSVLQRMIPVVGALLLSGPAAAQFQTPLVAAMFGPGGDIVFTDVEAGSALSVTVDRIEPGAPAFVLIEVSGGEFYEFEFGPGEHLFFEVGGSDGQSATVIDIFGEEEVSVNINQSHHTADGTVSVNINQSHRGAGTGAVSVNIDHSHRTLGATSSTIAVNINQSH